MTLEEDFALLLDFAELLEAMLLLDFTELLLDIDEDDLAELLLDRSSTSSAELRAGSAEDDECTELLDFAELLLNPFDSADAPLRVTLEEDGSSSRGAKLLSSSPHATKKNAKASAKMQVKEKCFIIPQIVCRKYRKRAYPFCKNIVLTNFFGSF